MGFRGLAVQVALGAMILLVGSCRPDRGLPPLPQLNLQAYQGSFRVDLESAAAAVGARPRDAEAVLRLGMLLHAREQYRAASQCYARAAALDERGFAARYYWALSLAADGDYASAAARLREALALRPDSIPVRLKLAEMLRESGQTVASAALCSEVLQRQPDHPAGHYCMARTLDPAQAVEPLQKALSGFPRYGAAQWALADAYRRLGRAEEARTVLRDYERDKTLDPPSGDPELAALRQLDNSATGLLIRAEEQAKENRLAEAVELTRRAIAADPKLVEAYVSLMTLEGRQRNDAEAERAYRQAIALDANRSQAHYNYGVLCFERQRFDQAEAAFREAIRIQPGHAEALNNLGAVQERRGRLDEAAQLYRRAIQARPVYPLAHFHLGRIYANQKKYAAAIAALEKSLEPESENTPAYTFALAATLARSGDRQRALEWMRKAQKQADARGQESLRASIDRDLAVLERGR